MREDNDLAYPALNLTRKTGEEKFFSNGNPINFSLTDFWQWSVSDLISNATRGILAEFIVASALDLTNGVRNEWDAFDLRLQNGKKLEVKSSAYLQSWGQKKLSDVCFKIRQTFAWESQTNDLAKEAKRQADIYVFCLLKHKDKLTVDPMNLDQWEFYLLRSKIFDELFLTQKSIGLGSLLKLNPIAVNYNELAAAIMKLSEVI